MTRFSCQPSDQQLGKELQEQLAAARWQSLDVAVAWVRRSGMKHIGSALAEFLARGGSAKFIVGIDIENTSHEGLSDLLALRSFGSLGIFVYHNEGAPVFHPKIYLFSGGDEAHLIVGSNNLTEAGLFTNTEASLQVTTNADDPVVARARETLDELSNISDGLAKQLDSQLLQDLVSEGYVLSEQILRERRIRSTQAKRVRENPKKYFATRLVSVPTPPEWPLPMAGPPRVPPPAPSIRGSREKPRAGLTSGPSNPVLVAAAPKSRSGWKQLQLNLDVMKQYFDIPAVAGEAVTLRQRHGNGHLGATEHRTIIFSASNKNVKVEIGGATGLGYPDSGYPIVIFRKVAPREFEYVIRNPGESGHKALTQMLDSATDTIGRGMSRVIRPLDAVRRLWPECPLT